ncbi:uncharacterized protein LOC125770855 [Anopheles funestus]|uniref:uncharacterized protein LOC125770855 n=1 Tax=Anopheles funestus TaxID=62324 RepID=UPI0020C63B47|nr:uncharacterized protein LOC125770855 [Anopheles funestus]XP_049296848.1 uncharacterized protein LOC125770855 [Anopheles funestus]
MRALLRLFCLLLLLRLLLLLLVRVKRRCFRCFLRARRLACLLRTFVHSGVLETCPGLLSVVLFLFCLRLRFFVFLAVCVSVCLSVMLLVSSFERVKGVSVVVGMSEFCVVSVFLFVCVLVFVSFGVFVILFVWVEGLFVGVSCVFVGLSVCVVSSLFGLSDVWFICVCACVCSCVHCFTAFNLSRSLLLASKISSVMCVSSSTSSLVGPGDSCFPGNWGAGWASTSEDLATLPVDCRSTGVAMSSGSSSTTRGGDSGTSVIVVCPCLDFPSCFWRSPEPVPTVAWGMRSVTAWMYCASLELP